MGRVENEVYYDEFSAWYELQRHAGYHALIDLLETEVILPHVAQRDVLEVGCGTGLILRHVAPIARRAVGIDISEGMLKGAEERGLEVLKASATELPFDDESFDVVYSFKVLAHVADIDRALAEAERVTRPGGTLFLEFYNPLSLRYLAKRVRSGRISAATRESAVYTRFDTLSSLKQRLPSSLALEDVHGIRVFTLHNAQHKVPGLRRVMSRLERWGRDSPLRYFGGFLVLQLSRR